MKIEWEWGYYGKCFIDGKFSHAVRIGKHGDCFSGEYYDKSPAPSGLMLGTIKADGSLEQAVKEAEAESLRIVENKQPNLRALRKTLEEYPFQKRNRK